MSFCLPQFEVSKFSDALKRGDIDPAKLAEMSSEQRRAFFKEIVGEEYAKPVNALFESKLLLKNQERGMVDWAKKTMGLKPEVRRDLITRIKKLDRVLDPKEKEAFLEDLASQKLGMDVTYEQAQKLNEFSKSLEESRAKIKDDSPIQSQERIEYGAKLALYKDYISSLKPEATPRTFKQFLSEPSKYFQTIANVSKSLVSSIDNSFWGNQGIGTLLNPRTTNIWVKNFIKSFGDIKNSLKGVDPTISARADVFSRPNALNGKYDAMGIDIGLKGEEAYPTSLPERIPIFGKLFRASSDAYNNAALRLRADLADRMINIGEKAGLDMTLKENAEGLGNVINSFTGRGSLGKGEITAPFWNTYIFSVKLLKGTFDTLTAHIFDPKVRSNPVALRQATYNLLGIASTYYGLTSIINALSPGSAPNDPRDPHFGQIKMGNSWVNVTGPYRPMVRLLGTIIPTYHNGKLGFWRKDTKGKWTGFQVHGGKGPGYGAFTPLDMAESFFENKSSPLIASILNYWRGKDFIGNRPTALGTAKNLVLPITPKAVLQDIGNPNVDSVLLNSMLNAIGFSVTTKQK